MNRRLGLWSVRLPAILVFGGSNPSWAHFHGGVGLYIGPGAFWYPGPYYDPYDTYPYPYYSYPYPYYDPYPYEPYVYAPYAPEEKSAREEKPAAPDESRHDLSFVESQLARAREEINFDYDDGDITKEQRKMALRRLKEIRDEAYTEEKSNGGFITGDQQQALINEIHGGRRHAQAAPRAETAPAPNEKLAAINTEISQLRQLLDKKLAERNITKAQRDGMAAYLDRTEKLARSQAMANGGTLTPDQTEAVRQQLDRAKHAIQSNLITN